MNIEELLHQTADRIVYPPTPEIRLPMPKPQAYGRTPVLRWAIAVLLLLLLAASLIAIPPVRAAIFDVLNIGVITIQIGESDESENLPPLLGSASGRTTLEQVRSRVDFPIRLPAGWGAPDEVYLQDWNGPVVLTLWRDPAQPNQIALALYHLDSDMVDAFKMVEDVEHTEVNGERALWINQPHPLRLTDSYQRQSVYLVSGAVLIWPTIDVTYRLETGLSINEAVRIAESLE